MFFFASFLLIYEQMQIVPKMSIFSKNLIVLFLFRQVYVPQKSEMDGQAKKFQRERESMKKLF